MPVCYCKSDTICGPDGKYVILEELGGGGQADAYLARDPRDNKVCLKALSRPDAEHPKRQLEYGRLLDQAARAPGWEHTRSRVVVPYAHFVDGDYFLVERYANGNTLASYLHPDNRIKYEFARPALQGVAVGLMLMERAGLAHRDVNPNNIGFIDSLSGAVLLDTGLAGVLLRAPSVPGFTPGYAPPEQYLHAPVSSASDVYSLGATSFHTLAGVPAFPTTANEVFHGQRWNAEHAKALRDAGTPQAAIVLIERMLSQEPHDRPSLREVFKTL